MKTWERMNISPFAKTYTRKTMPISKSINQTTLKAVRVAPEEWEKLDKAASWGVGNLEHAEKALKSKRRGYVSGKKRECAALTIDIYANSRNARQGVHRGMVSRC